MPRFFTPLNLCRHLNKFPLLTLTTRALASLNSDSYITPAASFNMSTGGASFMGGPDSEPSIALPADESADVTFVNRERATAKRTTVTTTAR